LAAGLGWRLGGSKNGNSQATEGKNGIQAVEQIEGIQAGNVGSARWCVDL